jgi:hypothetical protein
MARHQLQGKTLQPIKQSEDVMRFNNFGNTSVSGVDFTAGDRQAALRAMHRVKIRQHLLCPVGGLPMWRCRVDAPSMPRRTKKATCELLGRTYTAASTWLWFPVPTLSGRRIYFTL